MKQLQGTARGRIVELATNIDVSIGNRTVSPGDYVIADRSAAIFIRSEDMDSVLAAAEKISRKEAAMADAINAGRPISAVMGGDYEDMLKAK